MPSFTSQEKIFVPCNYLAAESIRRSFEYAAKYLAYRLQYFLGHRCGSRDSPQLVVHAHCRVISLLLAAAACLRLRPETTTVLTPAQFF